LGMQSAKVCAGMLGTALAVGFSAWGAQSKLPEAPGKKVVEKVCSGCHDPVVIATLKLNRDQWADKISHMSELGAKGTEAEFYQVLDYISTHFNSGIPKVNVNAAEAKEIEIVLELTSAEADSLVKFREQNGNFKGVDDLKKVPDLEGAKIEARKERLEFE
jgi:competence protein ComEA